MQEMGKIAGNAMHVMCAAAAWIAVLSVLVRNDAAVLQFLQGIIANEHSHGSISVQFGSSTVELIHAL
jgi:hypothetical protein